MIRIDNFHSQWELERFLTPLRTECKNSLEYYKKVIIVHTHRLYYFFVDLFQNKLNLNKVRWRNDEYIRDKISNIQTENSFLISLKTGLEKRGVKIKLINNIYKKIHSVEETRQLFEKANGAIKQVAFKNLSLRFADEKEVSVTLKFGAYCDCSNREIVVSHRFSENEALGLVIFELHNALETEKIRQIHSNIGSISEEEYATECERIEYENFQICHSFLKKVVRKNKWPRDVLGRFARPHQSFDSYLKITKLTGHFQYYVDFHRNYVNPHGRHWLDRIKSIPRDMIFGLTTGVMIAWICQRCGLDITRE